METINFKVDFDFFVKNLKFLKDIYFKLNQIEEILNCEFYGGPMDEVYSNTLTMWELILNDREKFDIFLKFFHHYLENTEPSKNSNFYYYTRVEPKIGEIKVEPNCEGNYCACLCKPSDMSWLRFIWNILVGENNDD